MKKIAENVSDFVSKAGEIPDCIYDYIDDLIISFGQDGESVEDYDTFQEMFGGDFLLIEDPIDLKEIETLKVAPSGAWKSVAEASSSFDGMDLIGENEYVTLLSIWNNAGGNTYFIPIDIYNNSPFLIESYSLTNGL